jgi:hypothetical protein
MALAVLWSGISNAAAFIARTEGRICGRQAGAADQESGSKEESCEGDSDALSHSQHGSSSVTYKIN